MSGGGEYNVATAPAIASAVSHYSCPSCGAGLRFTVTGSMKSAVTVSTKEKTNG